MIESQLKSAASKIERHFDTVFEGMRDAAVVDAMRYAAMGGKRLRGFLVLETARLHDVAESSAIWPACAIEAMHAYSLVHDDMPCMDDDDMRRGLPTVHRKWDEATAVLAGDGLQSLAFELATHPEAGSECARAELARTLAIASGARGMVLGQALDIAAETAGRALALDEITDLQRGKTGALIQWAATAGPRLAGADTAPLEAYASAVGLAFQIADDILDVEGTAAKVGKATGKDEAAGKATFVSLLGLQEAKRRANALVEMAQDALSSYGKEAQTLQNVARFVVTRET